MLTESARRRVDWADRRERQEPGHRTRAEGVPLSPSARHPELPAEAQPIRSRNPGITAQQAIQGQSDGQASEVDRAHPSSAETQSSPTGIHPTWVSSHLWVKYLIA